MQVLMVLRVVKSCQYHPKLYFITRTIELASAQLVPFFLVFVVILGAFAGMGHLLFGTEMADFVDLMTSILVMWDMLIGTYDYSGLYEIQFYGPFYIWSFYSLAFYVLLNMLLAIVMDAYAKVQDEDSNASPILDDLRGIVYLCGRKCCCRKGPRSFEEMAGLLAAHPGTQLRSPEEIGEVLQIGLNEAVFLFGEADEDVEEDEEQEANRDPKMKDILPINTSLELIKDMVDELQKQQLYTQGNENGAPPMQRLREVDRENMALKEKVAELQKVLVLNGIAFE